MHCYELTKLHCSSLYLPFPPPHIPIVGLAVGQEEDVLCCVQYCTVQCRTLHCIVVQCSAVQCSAVQCRRRMWVCGGFIQIIESALYLGNMGGFYRPWRPPGWTRPGTNGTTRQDAQIQILKYLRKEPKYHYFCRFFLSRSFLHMTGVPRDHSG